MGLRMGAPNLYFCAVTVMTAGPYPWNFDVFFSSADGGLPREIGVSYDVTPDYPIDTLAYK